MMRNTNTYRQFSPRHNQFVEDLKCFVDKDVKIRRTDGSFIKGVCHSVEYATREFIIGKGDDMILVRDAATVSVYDGEDINQKEAQQEGKNG
jgi:hypothetical protein